jgi:hypothetical protein
MSKQNWMKRHPLQELDIALNKLKSYSIFEDERSQRIGASEIDAKVVARGWKKLVTDGYAYMELREPTPVQSSERYFISFDGLLALADAPFPYKGKPYQWQRAKLRLRRWWSVLSTIAILINAIAVLLFTFLTYSKQFDKPDAVAVKSVTSKSTISSSTSTSPRKPNVTKSENR